MLPLLTNFSKFWVSRSKTLLKRRKIAIKKRPVSDKMLKQQAKIMNYAKQYRALQLQKQLDKRLYPNRHVDELMQEIFYPDIAYANQEALDISLRIAKQDFNTTDPTKIHSIKQTDFNSPPQTLQQISIINQQLKTLLLPEDLLKYYTQYIDNSQHKSFHIESYIVLFEQLGNYFANRFKIKRRLERDWEKKMREMKRKDYKFQVKICPYEFYDREDVYRVEAWNRLVGHFSRRILGVGGIGELMVYVQIAVDLHKNLGSIPSPIYKALTQKISQTLNPSQLPLPNKSLLLRLIALQHRQKYTDHQQIQTISLQNEQNLKKVCNQLCREILNGREECSFGDLEVVMNLLGRKLAEIGEEEEDRLRGVVLGNLSGVRVEKVIEYLDLYLNKSTHNDLQMIQILKFDIYRKLPTIGSPKQLIRCMRLIQSGKFVQNQQIMKVNQLDIQAMDLFMKLAETLSGKYCGTGILLPHQVRTAIYYYYKNKLTDPNLLQLIANQLVKNKSVISLEKLTESVFYLHLLGYNSPMLSQILFLEYTLRYQQTKNRYKNNKQFLLPLQNQVQEKSQPKSTMSQQQRFLEQSLIIALYMTIKNTKTAQQTRNKASIKIKIDSIFKLYPKKIHSQHILMGELSKNIYNLIKPYKTFWPIQHKPTTPQIAKQLKQKQSSDPHNKFYHANDDIINQAMLSEARHSQKFIYNYNYIDKLYLPETWSEVDTYSRQEYVDWVVGNRSNLEESKYNYFNREKEVGLEVVTMRKKVCLEWDLKKQKQRVNVSGKDGIFKEKTMDYKYYDLN